MIMIEEEYKKLVDIIVSFDSQLITVKSWGVTLGLAALGLGFKEKSWGYFLLAVVCGISFWSIECVMKGFQTRYYPRMRAIEYYLCVEKKMAAPRIDWSWDHAIKIRREDQIPADNKDGWITPKKFMDSPPTLRGEGQDQVWWPWYERMFWPHIMLPHVFTVILGSLFGLFAYRKRARFSDFGP
jgi:hypothetical protein